MAVPIFNGKPTYYSLTITKNGRTEKSLLEFKNKIAAHSDPRSNSGFIQQPFNLKNLSEMISGIFGGS
ncbi:MAG: hypothetical protein ACE5EH_04845 [Gammaproteobacteria bacterium]